jgi:hypothetical protein
MPSEELFKLNTAEAILSSIQDGTCASRIFSLINDSIRSTPCAVTEASIHKLATVFPDTLLLAALDLVDRDRGSSALLLNVVDIINETTASGSRQVHHRVGALSL